MQEVQSKRAFFFVRNKDMKAEETGSATESHVRHFKVSLKHFLALSLFFSFFFPFTLCHVRHAHSRNTRGGELGAKTVKGRRTNTGQSAGAEKDTSMGARPCPMGNVHFRHQIDGAHGAGSSTGHDAWVSVRACVAMYLRACVVFEQPLDIVPFYSLFFLSSHFVCSTAHLET